MNQTFATLFILFFSKIAFCQGVTDYEFVGTLQLKSGEIMSYKLNFTHFSDNHIEGFSLTDIYGEDRTKSVIKGTYDTITGKIIFYESANVSTKSDAADNEFCYIKANIQVRKRKGKGVIQGAFEGNFSNGKKCASGQLYLVSSAFVYKLADKYLSKQGEKNKDTSILNAKYRELKSGAENYQLTSASKLNLKWKSKELVLEIWDGNKEDMDEVELYLNNRKIIDRITIKQLKKVFVVPFAEKAGEIKIVAVSEGAAAPCTMSIILRDDNQNTSLTAKLKKGESVSIFLNR